jgi:hypothetical protein
MEMNSTTTTTTTTMTMTASKFSLCMLPSNIFVSQELGTIVARINELLAKKVGVCFEFNDSCAEFTAYYIHAFKHCKFQITVFYSTPTTPTYLPEIIQRRRRSSESGFFVEGNCLGGDRFLFSRIWSEIKAAITDDQNTAAAHIYPIPTDEENVKIGENREKEDAELAAWIRHEETWNAMMSRATESPSTPGKYIDEIFEFHTIICEFTLNPQIIKILVIEKNIIDYFMFHLVKHYDVRCFLYAALALENICEAAIMDVSLADTANTSNTSNTVIMTVLQNHAAEISRILAPIVHEGFAAHEVDATWTHLEYIEARRACARVYRILSVSAAGAQDVTHERDIL